MTSERTYTAPAALIKRFGTRDPFAIADAMGIRVALRDDFERQKGFFVTVMNICFIFINSSLSRQMQRIVCAHELGHAVLHRELIKERKGFLEWELFDMRDRSEFEANIFASELLIDEAEMLDYFRQGYDAVKTAGALDININLLMIKLYAMQKKAGGELNLPYIPKKNFLGTITDSASCR